MIELQTISITLAALSFILAAIYYIFNMRHARETRQAQLFMNIFTLYSSKQYLKDRTAMMQEWQWDGPRDFHDKYGLTNPDDYAIFNQNLTWLEGLGVLVKRGLIKSEFVHDLLYGFVINFWERHLPIFELWREEWNPKVLEDLEFLYNEMERLSRKHGKESRGVQEKPL